MLFQMGSSPSLLFDRVTLAVDTLGVLGLQTVLTGFRSYNFIKYFAFWNCNLGDEGLQLLIDFIKDNPIVESLELIDNVTPVGCGMRF
jgi:hypothetical protein